MSYPQETIAAIATAPENGAVGVIRVSGPDSASVCMNFLRRSSGEKVQKLKPRYAHFLKFVDQDENALDDVLVISMPGPKSFTGEDVVEIHGHGNLILLRRILRTLLQSGSVRAADAGEFSKRAFLNRKMDLIQAEAIHHLITAESEAALESSYQNLDGALTLVVIELAKGLKESLAFLEASFEFPEEDIQTFDPDEVLSRLENCESEIEKLLRARHTSKLYENGISVALVGEPNVGKSSLLNALLVEERAIVSSHAGTTRDVVDGRLYHGGVCFHLRDTAGLRNDPHEIEELGIQKSQEWLRKSDLVLWITDSVQNEDSQIKIDGYKNMYRILNKADEVFPEIEPKDYSEKAKSLGFDALISAKNHAGLDEVLSLLSLFLEKTASSKNTIHVNERQFLKLEKALSVVKHAKPLLSESEQNLELIAEDLRHLVQTLGEITGEISSDDVLGEVFQRFCIGK